MHLSFPPVRELLVWVLIPLACSDHVTATALHRNSDACQKTSVAVLSVISGSSSHGELTVAC